MTDRTLLFVIIAILALSPFVEIAGMYHARGGRFCPEPETLVVQP